MANKNLTAAKNAKNDEFYTQLTDIEKELMYYKEHFRDKVVFCNCDDPTYSNFWKYFHLNFAFLGLKKLIATHFDSEKPTYKLEYEGGDDLNVEAGVITPLTQNGDFRSPECIELLKEADIVVTNPPFSLFREYVAQLMEYGKKFVIIGNMNAITYKEFFPLLKENEVWAGYGFNMSFVFKTQYVNTLEANRKFVISKGYDPKEGYVKVPAVCWFTNLDIIKRHEPIDLVEHYSPEKYPHYDNYDAIEVSKTLDIPMDYDGVMGVPISFLDKYCPEQFELIQLCASHGKVPKNIPNESGCINGRWCYARILIRRKMKMNIFNNHDINGNEPFVRFYQTYIQSYPKEYISNRECCYAYIEEYIDKKGRLCARLKERDTNKLITFWTSPLDCNAITQKQGLLSFLSATKKRRNDDLYMPDGKEYILIEGIFGKETATEIEIISYFAELFFTDGHNIWT